MGVLFLTFVLVPFIELLLLLRIGRVVGAPSTIALLIVTGAIGAWLAKRQGRKVLEEWRSSLAAGRVPEEGVLGGVLVLVGGLLLITPGVLTDVAGLLCLLPSTRKLIGQRVGRYLARQVSLQQARVQSYGFGFPPGPPTPPNVRSGVDQARSRREDVIDTEGEEL